MQFDLKEQQFHNTIREYLVFFFIYCILFAIAYFVIKILRKTNERDDYIHDYDDAIADRVSITLCIFTLATCIGAILLLPISIIANEIIILYPNNYYWKWLDSSLIHGLWNKTFLFSNVSLFIFIPFAYFFSEAIGLPGYTRGIKSRIIETCLLLFVITFIILGISYVISSIIDSANAKQQSFFNISDYHLPFLYSFMSFIGVLFLLICTPLGFLELFKFVSRTIMQKRTFIYDLKEQLEVLRLQEGTMNQRIEIQSTNNEKNDLNTQLLNNYKRELDKIIEDKQKLEEQINHSTFLRNLCYPLIMIFLLILTISSIVIVLKNTFFVIFGTLPTKPSADLEFNLGQALYSLGFVQTSFEIMIIIYFMSASFIGLYSLPMFKKIMPKKRSTEMRRIILNCLIFLIVSSALPVSTKILGLTNFDLLGRFADLRWLGNVYIILLYNISFASATIFCLVLLNKFTINVRNEFYNRVRMLFQLSFGRTLINLNRSYSASSFDYDN